MSQLVTGAVAGDIAITAAEGGIGYWAQIDSYDFHRWTEPGFLGENIEVADDFVFYTIVDFEGEDMNEAHPITPDVIRRGVQLFLFGALHFQARRFADMDDLGAMDADEADAVIQLGVFGDLIYG